MTTKRLFWRSVAVAILGGFFGADAYAQVKPEIILARQPVQPGLVVATPTAADMPAIKAEEVAWNGGAKGVVVTDATGKKLRQFVDTRGGANYNIFSYYVDGVEAYREVDSKGTGKPDQFRWLGVNGSKWGADTNADGVIDEWYVLSPEEMSQELFGAVMSKDQRRLAALMVKEDDLKKLNVPAADIAKYVKRTEGAPLKLAATIDGLKLTEKAKLIHVTFGAPHCVPGDSFGGREDLMKHKLGALLVDKGDNKPMEMFQAGEMILVGRAWKMVDGPALGAPSTESNEGNPIANQVPKEIQAFVEELAKVKPPLGAPDMPRYQLERAAILEKCVAGTKGAEQYPWLKQLIDAYQAAVEADPNQKGAMDRLTAWKDAVLKTPANETQPYVVFRHAAAEFAMKLKEAKGPDVVKVQATYRDTLEAFVKAYPTSADAPEAMMRLAVAHEYGGKDGETLAKTWYEKLAKDFAAHPYAPKAIGAVKRLSSEGQPFVLAGNTFGDRPFTQADLAGKPAIVYFWASWGTGTLGELKALGELAKANSEKGLQIITVCLDDAATKNDAAKLLQDAALPGTHLHANGGLDGSPLALSYGIQMVPHIFLVDKDGKVFNRNAQNGPVLKEEVEKMLK